MIGIKSRVAPVMISTISAGGGASSVFVSHGRHAHEKFSCKQNQTPARNVMRPYSESPPKKRQARRSSLTDERWAEHLLTILEADTADPSTFKKETTTRKSSSMVLAPPHNKEKSKKPKRSVSFGEICIREYQTTLSDHPMCSDGPPIGLDWSYTEQMAINIEDYEADKLLYRGPNKTRAEMWLSGPKRWNLLLSMGHTARELGKASVSSKHNLIQSSVWRTISASRKKLPFQ